MPLLCHIIRHNHAIIIIIIRHNNGIIRCKISIKQRGWECWRAGKSTSKRIFRIAHVSLHPCSHTLCIYPIRYMQLCLSRTVLIHLLFPTCQYSCNCALMDAHYSPKQCSHFCTSTSWHKHGGMKVQCMCTHPCMHNHANTARHVWVFWHIWPEKKSSWRYVMSHITRLRTFATTLMLTGVCAHKSMHTCCYICIWKNIFGHSVFSTLVHLDTHVCLAVWLTHLAVQEEICTWQALYTCFCASMHTHTHWSTSLHRHRRHVSACLYRERFSHAQSQACAYPSSLTHRSSCSLCTPSRNTLRSMNQRLKS